MTMIETKDLTFAYPAEEGKRSEPALRGVSLGIERRAASWWYWGITAPGNLLWLST